MLRLQTLAAALLALLLSAMAASAQTGTHIVSILGTDNQWRRYQAKTVPLLFNRAQFGWRLHIGGPDRMVQLVEYMTTSRPMAYVVPSPHAEVNPQKTRVTVRTPLFVSNGYVQRAQGITPGDPPGTYTYIIYIDGELRGEFVFCAVEVPDQDAQVDPRTLACPDKFDAAEAKASFLPLF
jgi:hypothetical protein